MLDEVRGDRTLVATIAALALLSAATGFIHAAVIDSHRGHGIAAGAFTAVAVVQVAWAGLVLLRPSRWVLATGAAVNAAVFGGWALNRTVGIAFINGFQEVEGVALTDAVVVALEALLVLGALILLVPSARRQWLAGGSANVSLGIIGVIVAVLAVPAVAEAGAFHAHGQTELAAHGDDGDVDEAGHHEGEVASAADAGHDESGHDDGEFELAAGGHDDAEDHDGSGGSSEPAGAGHGGTDGRSAAHGSSELSSTGRGSSVAPSASHAQADQASGHGGTHIDAPAGRTAARTNAPAAHAGPTGGHTGTSGAHGRTPSGHTDPSGGHTATNINAPAGHTGVPAAHPGPTGGHTDPSGAHSGTSTGTPAATIGTPAAHPDPTGGHSGTPAAHPDPTGGHTGPPAAHDEPGASPGGHVGHAPSPEPAGAGVTPEQQAAADRLLSDTKAAFAQWTDEAAHAAGFRTIGDGGTGTEHLVNWEWITDDVVLDPNRPESLVYNVAPDGTRQLAAAMFILPPGTAEADIPDIGGTLTQWHIHNNLCFSPATDIDGHTSRRVIGLTAADGTCARGERLPDAAMLHVWIVDHPCGPFSALEGVGAGQAIDEAQTPPPTPPANTARTDESSHCDPGVVP